MSETLPDVAEIGRLVQAFALIAGDFSQASDHDLVDLLGGLSSVRHEVERCQALAAAEVARRSRPAFGSQGLARRDGHPTTTALLQSVTGATRREAAALVEVGTMAAQAAAAAADASASPGPTGSGSAGDAGDDDGQDGIDESMASSGLPPAPPWHSALGAMVARGEITVGFAEAIRTGLGEPSTESMAEQFAAELPALIAACLGRSPEASRRAARQLRDRFDEAGVESRSAAQHEAQFWRVWAKPDGMIRGEFELEPVAGMFVKEVFEQLAHPRRIPPKVRRAFGDPVHGDTAYSNVKSHRERAAAEGLVQLLRAGAVADPSKVLNDRKPSVRLVVNSGTLAAGHGTGLIEGHPDRVPIGAIHTGLCEGYLPIRFEGGAPLDLGRDERLYSAAQKAALAVRDGGCLDPDCDRPPSWTEVHHNDHWKRDRGRTDIADGILLCRRDHLRYHNEGWEVRREGATYWLIPPPHVDPAQTPRVMRPKTPADVVNPVDPTRLPAAPDAAHPRVVWPPAAA